MVSTWRGLKHLGVLIDADLDIPENVSRVHVVLGCPPELVVLMQVAWEPVIECIGQEPDTFYKGIRGAWALEQSVRQDGEPAECGKGLILKLIYSCSLRFVRAALHL